MGLPVTLIWIRPSPQCVRTAGRNKTWRKCAIRPLKGDNIMHTRLSKCDEAFSVQTYQIWTNQYVMNSYVMLLIMRELFCLNALWKVKSSHENKKFLMKRKLFIKDKRFFEVLLCYKDKVSNESTSLCLKVIRYLFLWTLSFITMKVIVFYEKKFIKKSFLIRQDVSSLIQSCQLSDLS